MEKRTGNIHDDRVRRSQKGDQNAMFELYRAYAKNMLNLSNRILNNREDAEDVLQEAFTEAFMKIKTFRFESSFGSWLKKIVINKSVNHLKKKRVVLQFEEEIEKYDSEEEVAGIQENSRTYDIGKIKNALSKLSPGFRLVFSLHAFEGYDHSEIAGILKISVSTSKSQYLRAKNKLVQLINN